ncbi:MAG: T9SS type A sorting domain-containing protein [Bacteroidetes bacterium]|nr:T9SS type A sorting domain-containing protein [Bacteroidota bacterium]
MYDIATQNPITGGTAVYIARAMLDMDVDDFIFENGNRIGLQNDNEIVEPNEFELVQTENNDNLVIFEKSSTLIQRVSMINVFGQTIYQNADKQIQYTIPKQKLAKGLYIIKVNLEQGGVLTTKYFSK